MKGFLYEEFLPINTIDKVDALIKKLLATNNFKVDKLIFRTDVLINIKKVKIQIYFLKKLEQLIDIPQFENNYESKKSTENKIVPKNKLIELKNPHKKRVLPHIKPKQGIILVSPKNIIGKTTYEIAKDFNIQTEKLNELIEKFNIPSNKVLDIRDFYRLKQPLNELFKSLGLGKIFTEKVELDPDTYILKPKYFPSKGIKGNYGKLIYIPTRS